MKHALIVCLILLATLAAGPVVRAEGTVSIEMPYAFAVPSGARSAAAFMTLRYPVASDAESGTVPDRLMQVQTPVAGRAEIHTILIDDNTMMMRKVPVLPLPPGGRMELSPQGAHIMMMELRQPLKAGESFPMTLVFEKAGSVEIAVPVRAPGDMPQVASEMTGVVRADSNAEPPEEKDVHDELEETLGHGYHH